MIFTRADFVKVHFFVDKMKDSDLKFVGSKLWALNGAERRFLGNSAESIPPRRLSPVNSSPWQFVAVFVLDSTQNYGLLPVYKMIKRRHEYVGIRHRRPGGRYACCRPLAGDFHPTSCRALGPRPGLTM